MTTTWVVVAHRTGARILENAGPKAGLELVHEIKNPEGRLKSGEIDTDRHGQAGESSIGQKTFSSEETAHDHVARKFAKEIAVVLDAGRIEGRYGQVILVAEPRFLGLLRGSLEQEVEKMVSGTVTKDLAHVEIRDLLPHLDGLLSV
jgi:protein required for attachment to host cells